MVDCHEIGDDSLKVLWLLTVLWVFYSFQHFAAHTVVFVATQPTELTES